MKKRTLFESFKFAISGLVYVLKTQRNMRFHLLIGASVLIGGLLLGLSLTEFLFLSFAVALVFIAEMINTAAEMTMDLLSQNNYHPLAKLVKDITAGAVLVASINALIVGGFVFFRYIKALPSTLFICLILIAAAGLLTLALHSRPTSEVDVDRKLKNLSITADLATESRKTYGTADSAD